MKNIVKNAVSSIKNWWIFLVSGILFIAASFFVVSTPIESYEGLAVVFSFLILFSGIFSTYFAIDNRKIIKGWGWYLAGGIFELIAGVALIAYPGMSVALLATFIGFWLLFRATQMIAYSIDLKEVGIMDWGWLMALGILVCLLSFGMILDPVLGFISVIGLTFACFMTAGIGNIWIAFKLRKIKVDTLDVVEDIKENLEMLKNEAIEIINEVAEEPEVQTQGVTANENEHTVKL